MPCKALPVQECKGWSMATCKADEHKGFMLQLGFPHPSDGSKCSCSETSASAELLPVIHCIIEGASSPEKQICTRLSVTASVHPSGQIEIEVERTAVGN
jgi:hypothetical protein